jgi:hypothetical protein
MRRHDLSLIVSRNVTVRDSLDRQQPFSLRVPGGAASVVQGIRAYDVTHLELYQADQLRGFTAGGNSIRPGRRVIAQELNDAKSKLANRNTHALPLATDGSVAGFVPAQRAVSWKLSDAAKNMEGIVFERNWITTQPGEIRMCPACHGVNKTDQLNRPSPANLPQALVNALLEWKRSFAPTGNPDADSDNDGIPDAEEAFAGTQLARKDNDVFVNSTLFARQMFRDFLAREGDAAGVEFWSNEISTGRRNRAQMVRDSFNSAEFQGKVGAVARLYFAYFDRVPDTEGLLFWSGQIGNGASIDLVSDAFAASGEFRATHGALTDTQFIDRVYLNILGRAADAEGRAFWLAQLQQQLVTRGQMMARFAESAEYRARKGSSVYVVSIYVGMLRRSPDAAGFVFWVGEVDAGRGDLAIINGFLGAAEYRARFL